MTAYITFNGTNLDAIPSFTLAANLDGSSAAPQAVVISNNPSGFLQDSLNTGTIEIAQTYHVYSGIANSGTVTDLFQSFNELGTSFPASSFMDLPAGTTFYENNGTVTYQPVTSFVNRGSANVTISGDHINGLTGSGYIIPPKGLVTFFSEGSGTNANWYSSATLVGDVATSDTSMINTIQPGVVTGGALGTSKLAQNTVAFNNIQTVGSLRLLGNGSTAAGNIGGIELGSNLSISGWDGTNGTLNVTGGGSGGGVSSVVAGSGLTGGTITSSGTIALGTSGAIPGTYNQIVVDSFGRVTLGTLLNYLFSSGSATNTGIPVFSGTTGTQFASTTVTIDGSNNIANVNSIGVGTINASAIKVNGSAVLTSIGTTGVQPGTYGDGSSYPQITVGSDGRITQASSISFSEGSGVSLCANSGLTIFNGSNDPSGNARVGLGLNFQGNLPNYQSVGYNTELYDGIAVASYGGGTVGYWTLFQAANFFGSFGGIQSSTLHVDALDSPSYNTLNVITRTNSGLTGGIDAEGGGGGSGIQLSYTNLPVGSDLGTASYLSYQNSSGAVEQTTVGSLAALIGATSYSASNGVQLSSGTFSIQLNNGTLGIPNFSSSGLVVGSAGLSTKFINSQLNVEFNGTYNYGSPNGSVTIQTGTMFLFNGPYSSPGGTATVNLLTGTVGDFVALYASTSPILATATNLIYGPGYPSSGSTKSVLIPVGEQAWFLSDGYGWNMFIAPSIGSLTAGTGIGISNGTLALNYNNLGSYVPNQLEYESIAVQNPGDGSTGAYNMAALYSFVAQRIADGITTQAIESGTIGFQQTYQLRTNIATDGGLNSFNNSTYGTGLGLYLTTLPGTVQTVSGTDVVAISQFNGTTYSTVQTPISSIIALAGGTISYVAGTGFASISGSDQYAAAFGNGATALGSSAIALGANTHANGANSVAIGVQAIAQGLESIAFIDGTAIGTHSIAMGFQSIATGTNAIVIGAEAGTNNSGDNSIIMGTNAQAGSNSFALGSNAYAVADNAIAMGANASATGSNSIVLGYGTATGSGQVVINGTTWVNGGSFDGDLLGSTLTSSTNGTVNVGNPLNMDTSDIGLSANNAIYFNALGGTDWRMGRNLPINTDSGLSDYLAIQFGTSANQGFVVGNGTHAFFEITHDGTVVLSGPSVTTAGAFSTSNNTLDDGITGAASINGLLTAGTLLASNLSGTNTGDVTISGTTVTALTLGSNLTFAGGTLSAAGGASYTAGPAVSLTSGTIGLVNGNGIVVGNDAFGNTNNGINVNIGNGLAYGAGGAPYGNGTTIVVKPADNTIGVAPSGIFVHLNGQNSSSSLLNVNNLGLYVGVISNGGLAGVYGTTTIGGANTQGLALDYLNLPTGTAIGSSDIITIAQSGNPYNVVQTTAGSMAAYVGSTLWNGTAPANSSAPGIPGQYFADGSYIYICNGTNSWVRTAASTF